MEGCPFSIVLDVILTNSLPMMGLIMILILRRFLENL